MKSIIRNAISVVAIGVLSIGCSSGSSTTSFGSLSSQPEAATASQKVVGSTVSEIEALYTISCGPTAQEPSEYLADGNEAFGCVVLNVDDETKYTETIGHLIVNLTSDDSSEYASMILADSSSDWHFFFQLAEGDYDNVTSITATAIVDGASIVKTIESPQDYDPESLN